MATKKKIDKRKAIKKAKAPVKAARARKKSDYVKTPAKRSKPSPSGKTKIIPSSIRKKTKNDRFYDKANLKSARKTKRKTVSKIRKTYRKKK